MMNNYEPVILETLIKASSNLGRIKKVRIDLEDFRRNVGEDACVCSFCTFSGILECCDDSTIENSVNLNLRDFESGTPISSMDCNDGPDCIFLLDNSSCEYCNEDINSRTLAASDCLEMRIENDDGVYSLRAFGLDDINIKLRYCPFCGRRLD